MNTHSCYESSDPEALSAAYGSGETSGLSRRTKGTFRPDKETIARHSGPAAALPRAESRHTLVSARRLKQKAPGSLPPGASYLLTCKPSFSASVATRCDRRPCWRPAHDRSDTTLPPFLRVRRA